MFVLESAKALQSFLCALKDQHEDTAKLLRRNDQQLVDDCRYQYWKRI
jgi:hypothetical protein